MNHIQKAGIVAVTVATIVRIILEATGREDLAGWGTLMSVALLLYLSDRWRA